MSEEIKQKAREEIKKLCTITVVNRAPDGSPITDDEEVFLEKENDEFVELFNSLLSQALQKRDEKILSIIDKTKQELLNNQKTTSNSLGHNEHIVSMFTIAKLEGEIKKHYHSKY